MNFNSGIRKEMRSMKTAEAGRKKLTHKQPEKQRKNML